jgi:hypothetical protein
LTILLFAGVKNNDTFADRLGLELVRPDDLVKVEGKGAECPVA